MSTEGISTILIENFPRLVDFFFSRGIQSPESDRHRQTIVNPREASRECNPMDATGDKTNNVTDTTY